VLVRAQGGPGMCFKFHCVDSELEFRYRRAARGEKIEDCAESIAGRGPRIAVTQPEVHGVRGRPRRQSRRTLSKTKKARCGCARSADKATAPWWRLILDARISNEYQDPWG
jgi:hypothetical protein